MKRQLKWRIKAHSSQINAQTPQELTRRYSTNTMKDKHVQEQQCLLYINTKLALVRILTCKKFVFLSLMGSCSLPECFIHI